MQIILASAKIMHDRFLDKPSDRAERFDEKPKLPAILAYHGQAYKHLKAETLNVDDFNYSQGKLWITSFLYGLLRPLLIGWRDMWNYQAEGERICSVSGRAV